MVENLPVPAGAGATPVLKRGGLQLSTLADMKMFAEMVAQSSFIPKSYVGRPGEIIAALQYGLELGLTPMQSLQTVAVINGKPSVYGDGLPGLCMASGLMEDYREDWKQDPKQGLTCTVTVKRKGIATPFTANFSEGQAKRANLLGKPGPWTQYTKRMIQMRARSFALRDAFPDVLRGVIAAEEAMDFPADERPAPVLKVDDVFKSPEVSVPLPPPPPAYETSFDDSPIPRELSIDSLPTTEQEIEQAPPKPKMRTSSRVQPNDPQLGDRRAHISIIHNYLDEIEKLSGNRPNVDVDLGTADMDTLKQVGADLAEQYQRLLKK